MKNVLMIINPCAGKRKINLYLLDIIKKLNERDCDVVVKTTQYQRHATLLVKEAQGYDTIICCGGDGTLNEVISGMVEYKKNIPLGYIPVGSTNDFAAGLNFPKSINECVDNLINGEPTPIDVGMFGDRYFSYIASFGAFTRISYETNQLAKNTFGRLAYILEGIKDIPSIHPLYLKIETDVGNFADKYIFGAITNSTSVGGVVNLDSELVNMNDGKFELILIKQPANAMQLNKCILALTNQRYEESDILTIVSIKEANINASPSMTWTLDGEKAEGSDHIKVKNLKSAISIITKKEITNKK